MFALVLPLLSCGHVTIKDGEDCADAGHFGASCFHELSDSTRDIPKEEWDVESVSSDHRYGMVCTSAENFADKKAALETLCQNTKLCDYQTKQLFEQFFLRVEKIQNKIKGGSQ